MSEIDKLIVENKGSFDRLEPSKDGWKKLVGGLQLQDRGSSRSHGKVRYMYLKVAAAVIVLVGISSLLFIQFNNSPEITENTSNPSTLDELRDITLLSPQGVPVTFDPTRNRYTLVQFWSSGSAICTEDACYYYIPAYEKYRDKGFEIYAISLDNDWDNWVNAIKENELPWTHASDLQGFDSPVCVECNITSVPTTFLLNHRGDIVARDLEPTELEATLDRLFMAQIVPG
ncbi:TlpA family protein disulfide reductase [Crocinitomix catalasitica]|nr:TlpA family protein disulfide reductase [Crocinitomix catalasitica]